MDRRYRVALAIAVLSGGAALAQDRVASPDPAFAVTSVKPNLNDAIPEGIAVQPDGSARFTGFRVGIRATGGVITGRAVSTAQLAGNLSGYSTVDRFVTDRTGLRGRYDFILEYSPAFLEPGDAVPAAGPSLFTALTEQLGLSLQPETVVGPVLVIDNVEKPAPD